MVTARKAGLWIIALLFLAPTSMFTIAVLVPGRNAMPLPAVLQHVDYSKHVVNSNAAGRQLLYDQPNNYGDAAASRIRVENACGYAVQVAIAFWFNTWGDPFTCMYKTTWGQPPGDLCVDYWYMLAPGEKRYLADTGYSAWYWTAFVDGDPSTTWGGDFGYYTLLFTDCLEGEEGCYGWSTQETGGLDTDGFTSYHARLTCPDYTGPPPESPPSNIGSVDAVRLVDGPDQRSGRLEVYINGLWGTVCDDGLEEVNSIKNRTIGNVVCRQLGYPDGGYTVPAAAFGEGTLPIFLDTVQCQGSEANLDLCYFEYENDCGHSEDLGVICPPPRPPPVQSPPPVRSPPPVPNPRPPPTPSPSPPPTNGSTPSPPPAPGPSATMMQPPMASPPVPSPPCPNGCMDGASAGAASPSMEKQDSGSGIPLAAIIGAAVGGVVVAVAAAVGLAWWLRGRRAAPGDNACDNTKGNKGIPPGDGFPGGHWDAELQDVHTENPHFAASPVPVLNNTAVAIQQGRPIPLATLLPSSQPSYAISAPAPPSMVVSKDPLLSLIASTIKSRRSQINSSMFKTGSTSQGSGALVGVPSQISVDFEELEWVRPLGNGSFGKVYLAVWRETNVAVKILKSKDIQDATQPISVDAAMLARLKEEADVLSALRHPNIVQYMGLCTEPAAIITEWCSRGSLTDALHAAKASPDTLPWSRRLEMILDAAKGMLFLHSSNPPIVHRDLKSPNLLVDANWTVKVCDFNLSRTLQDCNAGSDTLANLNPRWLAPEVMLGEGATTAADVFSFGVVMWELLCFELPWRKADPWRVITLVKDGGRMEIPNRARLPGADTQGFAGLDAYIQLLRRCWAQSHLDRPSFQQIVKELRALLESMGASQFSPDATSSSVPHKAGFSAAFGSGIRSSARAMGT